MSDREDKAHISLNKGAWRLIASASVIITLALIATLVAQASLSESGSESDPLTTLTLVLAVLAFLIQIFVFLFQSKASSEAVARSEDLQAQTRGVLEKIEANSSATQKVLFAQFDRLLDYIVGKKTPSGRPAQARAFSSQSHELRAKDDGSEQQAKGGGAPDAQGPLTKADLTELLDAALTRPTQRPIFSSEVGSSSPEDEGLLLFMEEWASEDEAPALSSRLMQLSPLGLATLVRFGAVEFVQRVSGEEVGLWAEKGHDFDAANRELLNFGLLRQVGNRIRLTDEGRALWRILPYTKAGETPEWVLEALKPLLTPLSSPH